MHFEINPKYQQLSNLVENIEEHCESSIKTLYDQRNLIRLINYDGYQYVVKSFKVPNLVNQIAYRHFRESKAKRSYNYSLLIGSELTPEPIAYIENLNHFLLKESYYISSYFDYDHTIHEVLVDKALTGRKTILEGFANFTFQLHEKEILHHDYSHGNILIKQSEQGDKNSYDFKIIDINRMEFKPLDLAARLNNFARINADDGDLAIITHQYAKLIDANPEVAFEKAKFYRNDFYKKRAIKNKLRGKA